ncbi:MAG: collagenase [Candidatus Lloydbacteria bacterium RIFCSPHIGHO2_01_FULL_49_22]|uniref:Collagenase n=1 Tax=Candidatus Lloydbacteria bacterium RIFCSPHIGHO2_01_FULL_49_22 TaxID=1798658 RepID=A0A1G2CU90_9BACT|nr:MAG: collagenase [Candidatus Lloydbacteria bacterium RIFCSPHIGHO2_01_FULL_49_22]OGZ09662.1 MAG: collagenase [Candidatus Lloydbacteria bacterium RIFCSPHIGHO2_02_FULL_50_18]
MISPHNAEIMAPAGSMESLQAAIEAGCDSIYFGVTQLNMRSRAADNMTLDDIKTVADICHTAKIKAYLVVNTLLYDHDTVLMKKIVDAAKANGVDAIIGFDFATLAYCNEIGMPVHVSVQFSVSNYESLKFFAKLTNRVVLARELTLDQIKAIATKIREEKLLGNEGRMMEIEAFVHGALCVAQSGRCFMSIYTDNSSANRGACRQNCRRAYKVTDVETGQELIVDNQFVMSAADICMIDKIPELLAAGVQVFKIEGRGRAPEYVEIVTHAYKQALKDVANGTYTKEKIETYFDELKTVYNRGQSHGNYYLGKELDAYSNTKGSQATKERVALGVVKNYFAKAGVAEILLHAEAVHIGDEIKIIGQTTGVYGATVTEMRDVNQHSVTSAKKGDAITIPVSRRVRPNDEVYLWRDKK